MTRPHDAPPSTFTNGPMAEIRRSARSRRAPTRYEPEERPEDDFSGSEGGEGEDEAGDADADAGSGSDSDDDSAGSLRDFVVGDEEGGSSDGEPNTDMLEDSDPEGYTTTEDDEMDWSPGGSSRTDSESEGEDESEDDRE